MRTLLCKKEKLNLNVKSNEKEQKWIYFLQIVTSHQTGKDLLRQKTFEINKTCGSFDLLNLYKVIFFRLITFTSLGIWNDKTKKKLQTLNLNHYLLIYLMDLVRRTHVSTVCSTVISCRQPNTHAGPCNKRKCKHTEERNSRVTTAILHPEDFQTASNGWYFQSF